MHALWLDVVVKLSLVLLLAFGAFSGLEHFARKAFGWRLVGYSIAALIVPAIWAARWSAFALSIRTPFRMRSTRLIKADALEHQRVVTFAGRR